MRSRPDSSAESSAFDALAGLGAEQLSRFIEHIPAAVAIFDREMRYLAASRRWRADYRLGDRPLTGCRLYEVSPELPDRWREAHQRCLTGAAEPVHDEPFERADGTIEWIHWEPRPWFEASGVIGGLVLFTEILTERKRAEALDERYRMLARHGTDIILFVRRADGRILEANDAAIAAYGYSREEIAERSVDELRAPGTRPMTTAQVHEADSGGTLFETIHRRKDGTEFPAEVSSRGATIGGVRVLLSVVRDITARKRMIDELAASEQRYRDLVHRSPDAVIINRAGGVEYANPAALALFGARDESDLVGREVITLFHPDYHDVIRERMHQVSAVGHAPLIEERIVRLDGSACDVEVAASSFTDHQGAAHQVLLRDISERRRLEVARREAERHELSRHGEARFRALIENSVDLLIIVDGDGLISFWSPGAEQMLGWTEEESVGRDCFEIVHPEDAEMAASEFARIANEPGATLRQWGRARHRDGSWRHLETVARNLLHDPDVQGIVFNSRDVTEERALQQRFIEAQKLEGIGRLAGGVAHDFNNLLTAILGGTEGVETALEAGLPVDREDVDAIRQAGDRARDLTRQLLSFARREPIAPRPLDPNQLVRDSEKLLRRLLPENVDIVTDLGEGLGYVLGDAAQLQQVILNLSVNARDAMPAGGTLTFSTRASAFDAAAASAAGLSGPCEGVRLVVRDSGAGMNENVRAHLFEPFFTTKPTGRGTGLGLAAVYGIVTQNHGRILVESAVGEGTTFAIDLPCTARQEVHEVQPAHGPAGGNETVLLVEDEELVRDIAARALRAAGYRVQVARDASEALDAGADGAGRIDILVTDVIMPGLNGTVLAEKLLARHPGLRVLFVSGYARDALGEGGVLREGVEFLQKPFQMSALLARVRGILDGAGARRA
jgi:PAS domain S-box-containing protein